jgi:hypothetical protein
VSAHDPLFEPLLGKRRTVRQALVEVAERWAAAPLQDAAALGTLEDAVRHLLERGKKRRELPPAVDAAARARAFVEALAAGQGPAAVDRVFPPAAATS